MRDLPLYIEAKKIADEKYTWLVAERERLDDVDQVYILGRSESNIKTHAIHMGLKWCKKHELTNVRVEV